MAGRPTLFIYFFFWSFAALLKPENASVYTARFWVPVAYDTHTLTGTAGGKKNEGECNLADTWSLYFFFLLYRCVYIGCFCFYYYFLGESVKCALCIVTCADIQFLPGSNLGDVKWYIIGNGPPGLMCPLRCAHCMACCPIFLHEMRRETLSHFVVFKSLPPSIQRRAWRIWI